MAESQEIAARGAQVEALLAKKDKKSALNLSLQNPPISSKSDEIKDANSAIVESVLAAMTESEISPVLSGLSLELCDTLMKYLYKLMAKSINCAFVLKVHAKLVEQAGLGSVVRVMTDRKQV